MAKICIHCYASGHVQGVFYRANTQQEAKKLGLSGWVKNLPDGRVEALACGDTENIEKLVSWMKIGPAGATVSAVTTDVQPWQAEFKTFDVIK